MQFTPQNAAKVMAGTKTQTRRSPTGQSFWVGRDYAVCPGRGKHSIGRIRIKRIWREVVGDISIDDAIAEGFETPADFIQSIEKLSGLKPSDVCVAHEFEVVKSETVK